MRRYHMDHAANICTGAGLRVRSSAILAFMLFIILSAMTVQADVTVTTSKSFKVDGNIIDLASSVDGKYVFVLTRGKVHIFDSEGKESDILKVDPRMTDIAVSGLSAAKIENRIFLSSVKTGKVKEIRYAFVAEIDTEGSPFLGAADAPVTIAIFSDFQCPYCARLQPLLEKIVEENHNNVKVVFKHFPLRMHKSAKFASFAAVAAQNQGEFWAFHDKLFENSRSLDPATFKKIAKELELDIEKFENDYKSLETRRKVAQDMKDGHNAGVRGTPTLFVNGRQVRERNLKGIQDMINEELAASKQENNSKTN